MALVLTLLIIQPGQKSPLYFNQENTEEFTIGLAMLNFDIVYLCWTQGKVVPLDEVPKTLRNLAECCEASKPKYDHVMFVTYTSRY